MSETNANARMLSQIKSIHFEAGSDLAYNTITWLIEQAEKKSDTDEIKVTKFNKGEPTVIDWNGQRWVLDTQTTFRGGVKRGKNHET